MFLLQVKGLYLPIKDKVKCCWIRLLFPGTSDNIGGWHLNPVTVFPQTCPSIKQCHHLNVVWTLFERDSISKTQQRKSPDIFIYVEVTIHAFDRRQFWGLVEHNFLLPLSDFLSGPGAHNTCKECVQRKKTGSFSHRGDKHYIDSVQENDQDDKNYNRRLNIPVLVVTKFGDCFEQLSLKRRSFVHLRNLKVHWI